MRIALGVEYDGTNYYGWQRQPLHASIQNKIEDALSIIAAESIVTTCAGRTDAGVHAFSQIVHFDTEAKRPDSAWILGTNSNLPSDIRILWARHVALEFHARYSALARSYRYIIYNNKVASALLRHRAMWVPFNLDIESMQMASQYLVGEHDFSSFRGSGCQAKSAIRNVLLLNVARNGGMINISIKGNAFLLHMVRNIVGVLLKVGKGECPPSWVKEVLMACDRKAAAITAPACGLYLEGVDYSESLL